MTLIISETIQNALIGDDNSLTNAFLILILYLLVSRMLLILKTKNKKADKILEGLYIILVSSGKPIYENMFKERVDIDDIMEAARNKCQMHKFKEIKYAILERDGSINIIPWDKGSN